MKDPHERRLAVVILNYNNIEYLSACMEHLRRALEGIRHEIWLVDNASTDGSALFAREWFPEIRIIESNFNGGFAYGNNLALVRLGFGSEDREREPRFPYVLLLNPDTEVERSALWRMLAYLDANPDAGVVGPCMVRPSGELDSGCKRGEPTPVASLLHMSGLSRLRPRSPVWARYHMGHVGAADTADVDSVMGACQLMRGSAMKEVGLLDDATFYMYGEDLDYCVRFRRAGWRVVYLGPARVLHHKGASTRKSSARMIREFHRAMIAFHRKHYAGRLPSLINAAIYGAVWSLGLLQILVNSLRPPAQRHVGSAGVE